MIAARVLSPLLVVGLACAGPQQPDVPALDQALFEQGQRHMADRQWQQASNAFGGFVRGCGTLPENRCFHALLLQGQAEAELGNLGQAIMNTTSVLRRSRSDPDAGAAARAQLAGLKERAEAWWRTGPADCHLQISFDTAGGQPRDLTLTIDARPVPLASSSGSTDGMITLFNGPAPAGAHVVDVFTTWPALGTSAATTRLVRLKPGSSTALLVSTKGSSSLQMEEATVKR